MVYRWENILNIPVNAAVQGRPMHSLLTHYGQVMLQQVRDHAATYINAQMRVAQNNLLLYTCLAVSITPETILPIMGQQQWAGSEGGQEGRQGSRGCRQLSRLIK